MLSAAENDETSEGGGKVNVESCEAGISKSLLQDRHAMSCKKQPKQPKSLHRLRSIQSLINRLLGAHLKTVPAMIRADLKTRRHGHSSVSTLGKNQA